MKYSSFHFSLYNNRSMLMPFHDRRETFDPPARLRRSFAPLPEEKLDREHPYDQVNTGRWDKKIDIGGTERAYSLYVPHGMRSKGMAAVVFPQSGERACDFAEKWKGLSEEYSTALIVLESDKWEKDAIEADFDYAMAVIGREFMRETVDICESNFYPIGFGDGAYTAAALALTYSATFPAFAADGDCALDSEMLAVLRSLPSDGVETLKKTDVAIAAFLIDRSGKAAETEEYIREILKAADEGLYNRFGRVYLQRPAPGAYFVNEQPVAQAWIGDAAKAGGVSREELDRAMLEFVLRYSRWGGFKNNHLRPNRTMEECGVRRVRREVDGLPRYFDVYVPTCFRPGDGRKYPLVVATHGMSCNSEYFAQTSDWHRLAEEREFFVVYTNGYPRNDGNSAFPVPHWALGTVPNTENVDEVAYFIDMLDWMEREYPIDTKRVYAVGHSNGGRMTQKLAHVIPKRFAAFAPTGSLGAISFGDVLPLPDDVRRPIWFIMGEYDLVSAKVAEDSTAGKTLRVYCDANGMAPDFDNWYDNGRYHTLVMYDDRHIPMVNYTVMRGCPHTYTAEMAQLTWDNFLCHFTREEDGSVRYHG